MAETHARSRSAAAKAEEAKAEEAKRDEEQPKALSQAEADSPARQVNTVDASEAQKTEAAQRLENDPLIEVEGKQDGPEDRIAAAVENGGIRKSSHAREHAEVLQELSDERRKLQLDNAAK